MNNCWHHLLLSMASFWRAITILLFGATLLGGILVGLPGRPVLVDDIIFLLVAACVTMMVHFGMIALAHRATDVRDDK